MDVYIVKTEEEFNYIRHELDDQDCSWKSGESLAEQEENDTIRDIQQMAYQVISCVDEDGDVMFEATSMLRDILDDEATEYTFYVVEAMQEEAENLITW